MLPTRRFYSQGFNIASYVARIEDIAKKQTKPKASGPKGKTGSKPRAQTKPKTSDGPAGTTGARPAAGAKGARPSGPRPSGSRPNGFVAGNSAGKPQFKGPRADGQPRPQQTPRPQASAGSQTSSSGSTRPQRTQQQQRSRPQSLAQSQNQPAAKPFIPMSGASQAFIYAEPKARRVPSSRAKPSSRKNPKKQTARLSVKSRVNTTKIEGGLPLVYSSQEVLNSVLQNQSSTFINIDPLTPRSIAGSLVQGPSFNARFWSVVQQKNSDIESAVNSQINGDFTPLVIADEKINQSVAQTLNANASLSSDQKQFLAKVSAGGMAPSQVKQVKI